MSWTQQAAEFSGLDSALRSRLDRIPVAEVPEGTIVFRPGDAVKGYVIVLQGKIGVHLVGPTGRDILLYQVERGQSCIQSTLGLMGGEDYSAEAVAEQDTKLVLMPRAVFLEMIDSSQAFRRMVFAAFAERMQSLMHVLERVAFQRVEARLAAHLLERADVEGRVRATQQELATAIGSAREVVSRRLDILAKRGWIAQERGETRVLNPEGLRQLAEETAV